jgi:uncharacterized protein
MGIAELNSGLEELTERECLELLATEELGRIGLVVQGRPEIFPVNYALDRDGCVVFRTAAGMKLAAAVNHEVVFEVDSADRGTRSAWSVIVHGVAHHTESIFPGSRSLAPWLHDKPFMIRITRRSVSGRRLSARK